MHSTIITRSRSRLAVGIVVGLALSAGTRPSAAQDEPRAPAGPSPEEPRTVTLADLLAYADEHSPALLVARATRSRADAEKAAAAVLLQQNPEISGGVGPRFGLTATGVDGEAGISQQLQIAGERGRRRVAAEKFARLNNAEIEQIQWTVHCDVHGAFHSSLIERDRARLAAQIVRFQEDVLRVVKGQVEAGEVSPLNLRLAEAEAAQARQVQVAADQIFLVSRIRLAQLAGWPATSAPMPAGRVDKPEAVPELDVLLKLANEHLPNLRTRNAAISEAAAREDAAARAAWSRPSVGVQYRHEGNPTSEGAYNIVLGTLAVPVPIFQRNQAERARANSDVKVTQADLAATKTLLPGQVLQARSEVVAATRRVESYGTEILPRFEENLVLLRRSFELGEIDLLQLSVARERFLRIQSDALSAHIDYFVALASLERTVGVDLWSDENHGQETAP